MKNKSPEALEPKGFLDFLASIKRLSPQTIEAYRNDLRWWKDAGFDLEAPQAPEEADVLRCLDALDKLPLETSTKGRRRSCLRSFVHYKMMSQAQWGQVMDWVPGSEGSDDLPKALSADEVRKLLDFDPERSQPEQLRNKALFELLYACGLRISEALALSWDDVDFQQNLIRVMGKGSKERVLPFSPRAAHWLEEWKKHPGHWKKKASAKHKNTIFLSSWGRPLSRMAAWKILHKRGLACGLAGLHPHVLRHSLATHLIQGGADVRMVQTLLGHYSLNTTAKYLKISDAELQTLFEEIHPLR